MGDDIQILSHMARVHLLPNDRAAMLAKARQFVGTELADEDIFTFRAEISNDLLDSHWTHMAESTLRNYAAHSEAGVAFLRGHNWKELPIGYSMSGSLEEFNGRKRVVTDFYTVRGLPDTNDLIHRLATRLVRDVSVGFGGGEMRCDICEEDFWDCRHWPGLKYEVKGDDDVIREVVATYTIEDAGLSEVSGVFDGSTPQAMVLKAERFAAAGLLSQEEGYKLERQYRMSLPLKRSFPALGIPASTEPTPKEEEMRDEQLVRLKEILLDAGVIKPEEREVEHPEETLVTLAGDLGKRVKALESLADDGRAYRKDLVDDAIAQGIRLYGNDFKQETYRGMLDKSPLENIKQTRDDWKALADKTLPAGRHSANDDDRQQGKVKTDAHVKDESYA